MKLEFFKPCLACEGKGKIKGELCWRCYDNERTDNDRREFIGYDITPEGQHLIDFLKRLGVGKNISII